VSTLTLTLLLALSAYRVWRLLALDAILDRPRSALFPDDTGRGQFLRCPWCAGFWVAAVLWALTWATLSDGLPAPGLVFGAAAALVALLGTVDVRWLDNQ
jgi:hypothetical protein